VFGNSFKGVSLIAHLHNQPWVQVGIRAVCPSIAAGVEHQRAVCSLPWVPLTAAFSACFLRAIHCANLLCAGQLLGPAGLTLARLFPFLTSQHCPTPFTVPCRATTRTCWSPCRPSTPICAAHSLTAKDQPYFLEHCVQGNYSDLLVSLSTMYSDLLGSLPICLQNSGFFRQHSLQGNYSDLLVSLSAVYSDLRGDVAPAQTDEGLEVRHYWGTICLWRFAL